MKISVTEDDISSGATQDCEKCPIALAISRAVGMDVKVGRWSCFLPVRDKGEDVTMVNLPAAATRFITNFDGLWHVEPFEFELDI